ncbi:hypothetical protein CI102_2334, partial [Trichoderma harzianum]
MLLSIDANFQPQVKASLKWLAFSLEPLNLGQLAEIFMLPSKSDDGFESMSRLFSSIDVLKYFPGLVVTEGSPINGASHVRLAHFSIKEYLTSDRILQTRSSVFAFTEADAHIHIGRFCLAYHLHISPTSEISNEHELHYYLYHEETLAGYACIGWARHIEFIPRASWPPEILRNAVLSLSIYCISLVHTIYRFTRIRNFIRQPYLYTATRGFRQLTEMLISSSVGVGRYLTQVDLDDGLYWATPCAAGNLDFVHLLLKEGANVNVEAGYHGTALEAACARSHTDVARVLLE